MGGQLSQQLQQSDREEAKTYLNNNREAFSALVNETHENAMQLLNKMAARVRLSDTVKPPLISDKEHDEFWGALDVFGGVMKVRNIRHGALEVISGRGG